MNWYQQRDDDENGEIYYEAHNATQAEALNGTWARFEGVHAKQACDAFIDMMNRITSPTPPSSAGEREESADDMPNYFCRVLSDFYRDNAQMLDGVNSNLVYRAMKVQFEAGASYARSHDTTKTEAEDSPVWNDAVNTLWQQIKPFAQKDMSFARNQLALCDKIVSLTAMPQAKVMGEDEAVEIMANALLDREGKLVSFSNEYVEQMRLAHRIKARVAYRALIAAQQKGGV